MTENGIPRIRTEPVPHDAKPPPGVQGSDVWSDQRFRVWLNSHVPLLYDWFSSRRMHWPSGCVQWGKQLPPEYARNSIGGGRNGGDSAWGLYLAERTGDHQDKANTLLFYSVRVRKEFATKFEDVNKGWTNDYRSADDNSCPDFQLKKRIIHNGEVNRVRCLKRDWVATHTDGPEIYVWDMAKQPHRDAQTSKELYSTPTLTLTGHDGPAEYAMATIATEDDSSVWVASGGRDLKVQLWKLEDSESMGSTIDPSVTFEGHSGTVEDVTFCPKESNLLASVGQDEGILFWDARSPRKCTTQVERAHDGDMIAVDWGPVDNNCLLTGGQDNFVKLWDRRYLYDANGIATPLAELGEHTDQILGVQWNPVVPLVLMSHSEDGMVIIWDLSRLDKTPVVSAAPGKSGGVIQPGVLFRHCGHRYRVADAQWLPDENDPWCMTSISEDKNGEGSTLQIWRMFDVIHRDADEFKSEMSTI
eukprot:Plantae.Rhodophyta-Hildenbrandia_rubra.ctg869.p1 GENE.Plantae.Rhodophyta-Hildenbrandia_rubra.ctg869~~Plantae.Rhodophyta-Hildenbrandia_rubra.ctg869.p1  ORF type:complete len:473 (+),score=62.49 Plantae.Rhodophyta-Hildenbrandia_rubra.ctg869:425-1843(+)